MHYLLQSNLTFSHTIITIKLQSLLSCCPCAVVTTVAAPFVLGAIGFTSAGIAAGSYAASMMSAAAIANGGGVAAGSAVAVLQSVGKGHDLILILWCLYGESCAG